MRDALQLFPPVDIIIPHYRGEEHLERCLRSLVNTRYPSMGIVVVDNASQTPGLEELIGKFAGVRLLALPQNRGYSGGCNAGFNATKAEFLVFMNDDTRHDPNWLEPLVTAARRDGCIAALQPKILSLREFEQGNNRFDYAGAAGGMLDRLGYPWCYGRTFSGVEMDNGRYDSPRNIFWASGVAMFVRRSVLDELGGFDDSFFMHMEEIDLSWRMQLAGYTVRSVPSSVVYHEGASSLAYGSPEKTYYNHRNNLRMMLRNMSVGSLMVAFSARLLLEPAAALFYLTKGRRGYRNAYAVLKALRDFLLELPETLRDRARVQALRKRSDTALFKGLPFSIFSPWRKSFFYHAGQDALC